MSTQDRLRYVVKHVTAMTTEVKNICDAAADEIDRLRIEIAEAKAAMRRKLEKTRRGK